MYRATTSNVWYVAQVSTYLFAIVALVCVAGGAPAVWAGIALGLAAMGRPHMVAMLPLIIALRIARDGVCSARWLVKLFAPVGAAARPHEHRAHDAFWPVGRLGKKRVAAARTRRVVSLALGLCPPLL